MAGSPSSFTVDFCNGNEPFLSYYSESSSWSYHGDITSSTIRVEGQSRLPSPGTMIIKSNYTDVTVNIDIPIEGDTVDFEYDIELPAELLKGGSVIFSHYDDSNPIAVKSSTIQITCNTPSASIYYTTDDSEPSTNSTLYSSTFNAYLGTTIKAKAYKDSFVESDTATLTI